MNPTRRQLLATLTGLCAASGATAQLVDPSFEPLMGVITLPANMLDPSVEDIRRFREQLKEQGITLPILILPPGVTWQTVTQEKPAC